MWLIEACSQEFNDCVGVVAMMIFSDAQLLDGTAEAGGFGNFG